VSLLCDIGDNGDNRNKSISIKGLHKTCTGDNRVTMVTIERMTTKMIEANSISDRLLQIRSLGFSIFREGEKIRVSPSGRLSPWDLEFLRENKPEILEHLQTEERRPSPTPTGLRPHTEPQAAPGGQQRPADKQAEYSSQSTLWVVYEDRWGNTRAAMKHDWDAYHQNIVTWPAWPGGTPQQVAESDPFPARRSGRRKLLAIPTGEVPRCWLSADPIPWET
jgi:hypothetical protein